MYMLIYIISCSTNIVLFYYNRLSSKFDFFFIILLFRTRKMAWHLRTLTALSDNPGWIPTTPMVANNDM